MSAQIYNIIYLYFTEFLIQNRKVLKQCFHDGGMETSTFRHHLDHDTLKVIVYRTNSS